MASTATRCLLLLLLLAGGCGGDEEPRADSDAIRSEGQDAAREERQSERERQLDADGDETQGPDQDPARGGALEDAVAKLSREGYDVIDERGYDPANRLRVLIGVREESADGYAKRAFFFLGGEYLGTDTSEDSLSVFFVSGEDLSATLRYKLYAEDDPFCCPSAGKATVTFRWDGDRLVPLDPIPPPAFKGEPGR